MAAFECVEAWRKGSEKLRVQECFFCDEPVSVHRGDWGNVLPMSKEGRRYVVCEACLERHGDTAIKDATVWPTEVFTRVCEYWWAKK
jgi:hypothetical protein